MRFNLVPRVLSYEQQVGETPGNEVSVDSGKIILAAESARNFSRPIRGTQRQFSENICSEDDLRSRIFGTFFVKFLACLPLLGF